MCIRDRYQVVQKTKTQIESYSLGEVANDLYEFIWGDFCDWYIELVKSRLWQEQDSPSRITAQKTLAHVLEATLKLLHPFMPHITEEIWQTLTRTKDNQFLAVQPYPDINDQLIDNDLERSFELLFGTIRTIRNLRAESAIKPGAKITIILQTESAAEIASLEPVTDYIKNIAKIEKLEIKSTLPNDLGQVIAGVVGTVQIVMPLTGIVDIPALRSKLEKSLSKIDREIQSLSGRLGNPGFVNKAPAEVIKTAQDSLAEAKTQAKIIQERLKSLN